ncbi:VOC family protein [Microbacterium sp. NPDC003461]|jgi:PhnB protein
MSLSTTTHLNLPGTAREALTFYQGVFGGRIHVTTYGEVGIPQDAPDAAKVVFGSVEADNGFRVMAYDIPGRSEPFAGSTAREHGTTNTDQPFFVAVRADSLDEARGYWEKLAEGATIVEPLAASEWSAGFGMLTDAFGVTWSVDVASAYAG